MTENKSENISDKYGKIDRYKEGTTALYSGSLNTSFNNSFYNAPSFNSSSYNIPYGNNIPWVIDPRPMPIQKPLPPLIRESPLPYPIIRPIMKLPSDTYNINNW